MREKPAEGPGARRSEVEREQLEIHPHKLFAPQIYRGAIARSWLLQRSFDDTAAKVVVLQGPAGHGKTTTLQQLKTLCDTKGYSTGWLTFDEGDNDIRRFSVHLRALINQAAGRKPRDEVADGTAPPVLQSGKSDWLIDRLLSARKPIALFLDEFQVLNNRVLLNFCREFLEHTPANTRIYIGSRSIPEMGLARMVVNNHAVVLRADDLRFSRAEVASFFDSLGDVQVSSEEVEAIYRHTEGWPAAVQLFRLSLASPDVRRTLDNLDTHRPRELAEYLTDSVLSLQEPDIQDFLLRTSLLLRLSAPLCEAVTGRKDAQELLLGLERAGLFVRSLDSEQRWFKFHGLFSSFLAEQFNSQSRESAIEVHRRAAQWHLQHDHLEDTIHHAIECADFSLAADTLNHWATRLVAGGALIALERWFDRIPFEEVAKRGDLVIKVTYALVFLRRRRKLRAVLDLLSKRRGSGCVADTSSPDVVLSMAAMSADESTRAFEIIEGVCAEESDCTPFGAFELGAASNLFAYKAICQGNFERVREHLSIARSCNDFAEATFSHGYTIGVGAMATMLQGRLDEALGQCREGVADQYEDLGKSFSSAALASCYVWALYEANQLDLARTTFDKHHDIIAESALPDFFAVAYMAMARVCDATGQESRAEALLDEAESIALANLWPRIGNLLHWERIRRAINSGELERAHHLGEAIATSGMLDSSLPSSEELEGAALGQIRLALHCGDADEAAARLEVEWSRARQRPYRQIKLHLLDAVLEDRRGHKRGSHAALREALQLAQFGGFVRLFADEGPIVRALVADALRGGILVTPDGASDSASAGAFLEAVRTVCQSEAPVVEAVALNGLIEPLTDRELSVLVLLGDCGSNREIASRLFVSENTVKFHLKNIYSKLSVSSRLQAISAARHLRLLN